MTIAKRRTPISVKLPVYGVYVFESYHAPGFRMRAESHRFLEIFFVHGGRGHFKIGSNEYPCGKNDLVIVPPLHLHTIHDHSADPLTLYAVCVSPAVVEHEDNLLGRLPVGTARVGNAFASQTRSIFRQLLFEQTRERPFGRTLVVGLTLQLLANLARRSAARVDDNGEDDDRKPTPRRTEVQRYVDDLRHRFFEHATIDSAAEELGMSRRRFTALFFEITGKTWSDFVAMLRIQYSCKLLRETTRSVVAIAFECGFEEISSFYRAFKREMGDSPGHWRDSKTEG